MSTSTTPTTPYKITPLHRSLYPQTITHHHSAFKRLDPSPDTTFYSQPRFVQHIDAGAISSLQTYYSSFITPTDKVLDICSSWVSHLPSSLKPPGMIGYGMNVLELQKNPHLSKFYVRDFNEVPSLKEVESESIDVVICNVSIDYLTKPIEVLGEARRVLKRGGTAHMAFSDRCFPTKVIGVWRRMSDEERRVWVGGYFWREGGWRDVEGVVVKEGSRGGWFGGGGDPMFVVRATKA